MLDIEMINNQLKGGVTRPLYGIFNAMFSTWHAASGMGSGGLGQA